MSYILYICINQSIQTMSTVSATAILKVMEVNNPDLVDKVRSKLRVPVICLFTVDRIFNAINTGDDFKDRISFIACILKLYSPETLIADCKARNGVCAVMARQLNTTQQNISYYVKYAKHYYTSLATVRDVVNNVIEKIGGNHE